MNCTHPVLYLKGTVLYCKTCGAVLAEEPAGGQIPVPAPEPQKPAKRKATRDK